MTEKQTGIIVKGVGGLYDVLLASGERISCRAKGSFRHEALKPCVGDSVSVGSDDQGNTVISEIGERKNSLIRPPISNIDTLFVVLPSKDPIADLLTADKLIAIAEYNRIEPIIIVTKCDLDPENADRIRKIYEKSSFKVFLSSLFGGNRASDCENLKEFIKENASDKVSAFAGASGAGKSTLMNAIFPSLAIETGEISKKIGRGRHTTRHVELFPMKELLGSGNGFFADTPGFTMLDFMRFDFFDKEALPGTFREFEDYLGSCRYTKCTHTKEDGCAILGALKEKKIARSRHESYLQIYSVLKEKHEWDKKQ
ncbi:MAG: ribosome small subunit-dependent GTPase A [Clostridia bacterium]|nr:ribosome small subunit-dependent GTPase A [Clostridia bacterium]